MQSVIFTDEAKEFDSCAWNKVLEHINKNCSISHVWCTDYRRLKIVDEENK